MELLTKQVCFNRFDDHMTSFSSTFNDRIGGNLWFCMFFISGLEQCLFHRVCHYADKCNSGQRKSQGAVWSQ